MAHQNIINAEIFESSDEEDLPVIQPPVEPMLDEDDDGNYKLRQNL